MLNHQVSKLLVQVTCFSKVRIIARPDQLHIFRVDILEKSICIGYIAYVLVDECAYLCGFHLLDVEPAVARGEAARVEVEGLTPGFGVETLDGTFLVTLIVHLDVLHDLGPRPCKWWNGLAKVEDHLCGGVAEGFLEFVHQSDLLSLGL